MKSATIHEIKQELVNLSQKELLEISLRIIKYKKENKELAGYILFDAGNISTYIENIKQEMDDNFKDINTSNIYFTKKSLRKILKATNRYIKYTLSKEAEAELLMYYCNKIKSSGIKINKSGALVNIYNNQIKKIQMAIASMHEDLQFDYNKELEALL